MGKDGRLCSPRFIFYFEKCLQEYGKVSRRNFLISLLNINFSVLDDYEALQKLEFDTEDKIYKMLRNEFIITNNRLLSI